MHTKGWSCIDYIKRNRHAEAATKQNGPLGLVPLRNFRRFTRSFKTLAIWAMWRMIMTFDRCVVTHYMHIQQICIYSSYSQYVKWCNCLSCLVVGFIAQKSWKQLIHEVALPWTHVPCPTSLSCSHVDFYLYRIQEKYLFRPKLNEFILNK